LAANPFFVVLAGRGITEDCPYAKVAYPKKKKITIRDLEQRVQQNLAIIRKGKLNEK
jgi:hypothetical protein